MAKVIEYMASRDQNNDAVFQTLAIAEARGTVMRKTGRYEGRRIEIDGRMLYNFGCCSYMGLDTRPELIDAAAAAAHKYGTQISISRALLECELYGELEASLEKMTGRPVLAAPSTTLAHMAALPAIVGDNDAVLLDQFAHASLHMATELLGDAPVHLVRHGRLDLYEQMVTELSSRHEKVWLITDGLFSMSGSWAPFDELANLLARYPRLHLYIDDAHGTGWFGTHGRGGALTHLGHHDRVVVALSLCKSFGCAGGALALPGPDLKTRIRRCGGPMLFSGPIQPPMLGAAVASAALHLGAAHSKAQTDLLNRIDHARATAARIGLRLAPHHRTPIFIIPCESADDSMDLVQRLLERGFFACLSVFPAVPVNRSGVRFIISLHNEHEDIDAFLAAAAATR